MSEILVDIRNESESIKEEFKNKDRVTIRELLDTIADLRCEKEEIIEHYEDVIKNREEEIQENYRQLTPAEIYGF